MLTQTDWEVQLIDPDHPEYWLLRLGYADYLEESGRDKEARAWRKIVEKGWRPGIWINEYPPWPPYWWFEESNKEWGCHAYLSCQRFREEALLPKQVFSQLSPRDSDVGKRWGTQLGAELALVEAIIKVKFEV